MVGRALGAFIIGAETGQLYRVILTNVRTSRAYPSWSQTICDDCVQRVYGGDGGD